MSTHLYKRSVMACNGQVTTKILSGVRVGNLTTRIRIAWKKHGVHIYISTKGRLHSIYIASVGIHKAIKRHQRVGNIHLYISSPGITKAGNLHLCIASPQIIKAIKCQSMIKKRAPSCLLTKKKGTVNHFSIVGTIR